MKTLFDKNFFTSLIIYSLIFIFTGCSKEETEETAEIEEIAEIEETAEIEELYFTLNTNDIKDLKGEDWIVIHNSDGVLLDYVAFEKNEILEFKEFNTLLTDKITVTYFSYLAEADSFYHKIKTYTEIDKGSIWRLIPDKQTLTSVGKFDLSVNHPSSIKQITCSNGSSTYTNYINGATGTNFQNIYLVGNENDIFTSILDINDGWKYKVLENVTDGDNLFLNYSEFQDFDTYLNIDLPKNVNGNIGYSTRTNTESLNNKNYTLIRGYSSNNDYYPETLKLGYLNRFDKYKTEIYFYTDKYFYSYKKNGDVPSEIIIPIEPSISIDDSSIFNFKMTTNVNYNYKYSLWSFFSGTTNPPYNRATWKIFSPKNGSSIISDLPNEITQNYPNLNTSNLSLDFNELIYTDTYYNFIDREFITGENNLNNLIIESIGLE